MSRLSSKARALLDEMQFVDEPSKADFDRVHAAIGARIAIGAAAGAVVLLSADAASAIAAPVANGVANGAVSAASAASVAAGAAPVAGGGTAALGITSTATIAGKMAAWAVAVALTGGAVGIAAKHVVGSRPLSPEVVETSLPNVARNGGAPVGLPIAPNRTGSEPVSARRAPTPPASASPPAASASAPHPAREVRPRADAPTTAPDVTGAHAEEPAPSNGTATLDAELALVRRARAALNDGRPKEALAALDEHASRFPNGVLAEDRAAQRVLALCALARTDAAREEAQRFFLDYPRSPHVAAIRSSCAFTASSRPFGGLHE